MMSLHKKEAMTVLLEYVDIGTHVLATKSQYLKLTSQFAKINLKIFCLLSTPTL